MPSSSTEPPYDCPVCTGLPMQKLKITRQHEEVFLTLDCCHRCGGVWFDEGEVQLSQKIQSPKVRQHISQKLRPWMIHCQNCNTLMDRNLEHCGTCGWHNRINCPVCTKVLERKRHKGLTLDICHSCHGVWFDQTELATLWKHSHPEPTQSARKQPTANQPKTGEAPISPGANYTGVDLVSDTVAQVIVEGSLDAVTQENNTLFVATDLVQGTVESLARITGAALESVGELPELATVILEVTGEIAGSMTEGLAEVIADLF
ncbi:MAG: zf-TFIIB domain-containing protein [Cyanobacteria bacterium J06554_1]